MLYHLATHHSTTAHSTSPPFHPFAQASSLSLSMPRRRHERINNDNKLVIVSLTSARRRVMSATSTTLVTVTKVTPSYLQTTTQCLAFAFASPSFFYTLNSALLYEKAKDNLLLSSLFFPKPASTAHDGPSQISRKAVTHTRQVTIILLYE